MRLRIFAGSVLIGCAASGCGDAATPAAPAPSVPIAKPFLWETSETPYEILGVTQSNVLRIGDQARTAQAVYPHPTDRAQIEAALTEIYAELKRSIEDAQRDATYRRINISIYDSHGDVDHDSRAWLCNLQVAPEAGTALPEWPAAEVQWQWRDPAAAPTEQERVVEWQYLKTMAEIDAGVDFGITDAELMGMNGAQRRDYWENRYKVESKELKSQMAAEHNLTVDELEQLLDRILAWKYGTGEQAE